MLDQTLRLLDQLVDQRMRAAGDVPEVSLGVWAIHGSIPVDGEVILAEFSVLDEARSASCGGGSSAHLVTLGSWSVQTAFLSRVCRDEAGDRAFPRPLWDDASAPPRIPPRRRTDSQRLRPSSVPWTA